MTLLQNAVACPSDVPVLTLPNGDANRDGKVDEDDYRLVDAALGTSDPNADLNGDGAVKDDDLALVKAP